MRELSMSDMKWGHTPEDIDRAIEEVRRILIGVARDRRKEGITYTE